MSLTLSVLLIASTDPNPTRLEVAGLPALTYRSDAGLGMGVLGSTTRFRPNCAPFCWRLLSLVQGMIKSDEEGVRVPTRNAIVFLDLPEWRRPNWRMLVALANFDDRDTGYRGIGTRRTAGGVRGTSAYRWHRRVIGFKWRQRWMGQAASKVGFMDGYVGTELGYNNVEGPEGSQLTIDQDAIEGAADPWARAIKGQLGPFGNHAEIIVNGGLLYDHRDHEFTPSRGGFHESSLRVGRAGAGGIWSSLFLETSWFRSLMANRFVVAGRLVLDHAVGDVPVYRRAEMGGLIPSLGASGAEGIRGIPTYREAGKTKLISNLEARLRLLDHRVARQNLSWRLVGFYDAGRAWSDLHNPELRRLNLDGRWHQFLVGVGAGLRLRWGQAFVLRIDNAWSPTLGTRGVYFGTDHIF